MSANQGTLRIAFPSAAAARRAQAALAPDDGGHIKSRCEGTTLVLDAAAGSPMGLLRTLDDALACLRAL
ncbi:MAG: hypothetical protein QOD77_2023 [Thermoplasmata archaeon]|nr:hypothetical protein [Thermoplasmata archaeon]